MGRFWYVVGAGALLLVGARIVSRPTLKHFSPAEFGPWYPLLNAELLTRLDALRELWGHPIKVSPVAGAIGRHGGAGDESQHNVDKWGEVRAIDLLPMEANRLGKLEYLTTLDQRRRLFAAARAAGFTGIGIYTDTMPGNLLHVDVRPSAGHIATWSRVHGAYLGIDQVLA